MIDDLWFAHACSASLQLGEEWNSHRTRSWGSVRGAGSEKAGEVSISSTRHDHLGDHVAQRVADSMVLVIEDDGCASFVIAAGHLQRHAS